MPSELEIWFHCEIDALLLPRILWRRLACLACCTCLRDSIQGVAIPIIAVMELDYTGVLTKAPMREDAPVTQQDERLVRISEHWFSALGPVRYLLEMLSAFQIEEEIWLVLENADGGDLFGRTIDLIQQSERVTPFADLNLFQGPPYHVQ